MASREVCLVLYHDPTIGIDEAAKALSSLAVERRGDVLHVRWKAGRDPELRVRAVSAVRPDGSVRWERDLPEPVAEFLYAFEISFDDLEEVLDETNALIDVQLTLVDLTSGANYRTWNGNLTMFGED